LTGLFYTLYKKGVRGILLLKQLKLTKKQMALVDTIVATGCSVKEASAKSGYAKGESGRVTASKTLRLNATIASRKVLDLASSAKSEYVQLEASKDILDRAGYKPVDKAMHLVQGNISVSIDLS
jgi:hypothetical protein